MAVKKEVKIENKAGTKKVSARKPLPKNVTTKKRSAVVSKKTPVKKNVTKASTKRTSTKKNIKAEPVPPKDPISVNLPKNMSLRSLEKSFVLRAQLDEYLRRSMYRIAYVSSMCFLLVGASLIAGHYMSADIQNRMLGAIIDGVTTTVDGVTTTTDTSTANVSSIEIPPPEVSFPVMIPGTIIEPTTVVFVARNVSSVKTRLEQDGKAGWYELPNKQLLSDKYEVTIDNRLYPEGYYRLRVDYSGIDPNDPNYKTALSSLFYIQPIPSSSGSSGTPGVDIPNTELDWVTTIPDEIIDPFKVSFIVVNASQVKVTMVPKDGSSAVRLIPDKLIDDEYSVTIPTNTYAGEWRLQVDTQKVDGTIGSTFHSNNFVIVTPPQTDNSSVTTTSTTDSATKDTTVVDDTSDTIIKSDTTSDPVTVDSSGDTPVNTDTTFALVLPGDAILSGRESIYVSVPKGSVPPVNLFARLTGSLNSVLVTSAVLKDRWTFDIDSVKLPNGDYEFYAQTKLDGNIIKTKPVKFTIINYTKTYSTETTNTETVKTDSTTDQPIKDIVEIKDISYQPVPPTEEDIERETERLIQDNITDLDSLFKQYVKALQSGDAVLIEDAKDDLDAERVRIAKEALESERLANINNEIDQRITFQIDNLRERVDTFEKVRTERVNSEVIADTDNDGISDYDEEHLYKTDPKSPDSDNDGINDDVELASGYDPNNESSDAQIHFESPKETFGLVRNDALTLDKVVPVEEVLPDRSVAYVKTEVHGRALPNSFVTLYIFSTPTVVTIKTDADGQFVYTFDKELEDGRHDVYVAMTNNTGEIIAQSDPLSFTKVANAYTSVNEMEAVSINADTIVDTTRGTYNLVVGLGILALGLILLMLGISLRSNDDDNDDDTGTGDDDSLQDDNGLVNRSPRFEHIDAT